MPVVGGNLDSDLFASNPDFFTAGGTADGIPEGIVAAAKTAKVDKLGVLYCSGVPICAELPPALKEIGAPAGVSVSYSGAIPNAAPNYTAPCLAAQQSGANGLFIASGPPQTLAVAQSCTAQGYKPTYVAAESSLANSSLSNPAIDGAIGEITNLPASDTSNPQIKAMDQALNTFKPGLLASAEFSPGSSMVWAAGQLFEAAAQAAHLGDNPTPAQVLARPVRPQGRDARRPDRAPDVHQGQAHQPEVLVLLPGQGRQVHQPVRRKPDLRNVLTGRPKDQTPRGDEDGSA